MICPICEREDRKSCVYVHGTSTTLVAYFNTDYYDEDGKHHNHDDNCRITNYSCSNGHRFTFRRRNSCWCGWKGKEECFCHPLGCREVTP